MEENVMQVLKEAYAGLFEWLLHISEPLGYYLFTQLAFFWTVFIFARFTLGRKTRRVPLIFAMVWSILPFINALFRFGLTYFMMEWQFAGYLLIYLIFSDVKWVRLMIIWFFVECVSNILSHFLGLMIGNMPLYGEILVATFVGVCFSGYFISPLRTKLRDLLDTTPRWAHIYAMVVMYMMIGIHQILVPGGAVQTAFIRMGDFGRFLPAEALTEDQFMKSYSELWVTFPDGFSSTFYEKFYPLLLEVLLCIAFVVFMVASRSNKMLKQQNENFEKQIEAQAEHYRNLAAANAEVRRFRHDFKNVRFALEKLLSEGKKTEALAVMQEFSEALDSKNRYMILFDTGNGIADALLTDKLYRAKEKDTTISFKGAISSGTLAATDLCVLLGNSIDNAIEACEKLPEGMERSIHVECNCSSGFLFLTVRNPIAKAVAICDNRVYTTKKDSALHGFGISSMHKVAKKYDGTVKLDGDGGYFTVNIELCLPAQQLSAAG